MTPLHPTWPLRSAVENLAEVLRGQGDFTESSADRDAELDRYGHLFDGLDEAAAERLDLCWDPSLAPSPRPPAEVFRMSAS